MSKQPFLTIITRCYKRPRMLERNKDSIASQTDPDVQQAFIVDEVGLGMEWASASLNKFKDSLDINGKYVMTLDDDDMLVCNDFIESLKIAVKAWDDPDVMIFKGQGKMIYPPDELWKKTPVVARIASFCFCIKQDVWKRHIHEWAIPVQGDFKFISTLFENDYKIGWMDKLVAKCQSIRSYGKPEV